MTDYCLGITSNWFTNRKVICSWVYEYLKSLKFKKEVHWLYIEKPMFMETHKGITAARSDSLYKLITIYGGIIAIAEMMNYMVYEIPIPEWKGQMNKRQVDVRIRKILNLDFNYPDHVSDAVGMGLYLKGLM